MRFPAVVLSALVVTTSGLAGCTSLDRIVGPDEEMGPEPFTTPWFQDDCATVGISIPIARDDAAKLLPEGYEPAPAFEAFGVPESGDRASITVEVYECADIGWIGGGRRPMAYAELFIAVEPPEAHRRAGADGHFYRLELMASDRPLLDLFSGAGQPVLAGTVDAMVEATDPLGALGSQGAARVWTGPARYEVAVESGPAQEESRFAFRAIRESRDGVLYLDGTGRGSFALGTGRITMNEGSFLAETLRTTETGGVGFTVVDMVYEDATLTFR